MAEKEEQKIKLDNDYSLSIEADKKHVFGEGNLSSGIVFIGEAPGGEEEKEGHPFVGKAGKNLSTFLDIAGIERSDVYITNAVKFRPTDRNEKTGRLSNRTPTSKEIIQSREFLLRELSIVSPRLVITLGNTPLFSLTNDSKLKITSVHGKLLDYTNSEHTLSFKLMPFYHPAAVIYRRELITEYKKDLVLFSEIKDNFI